MKKCAWLLTLATLALFVCSSLALAQEKESEAEKTEKSEKQMGIKLTEGMDQMMSGCHKMGQMGQSPSGMMMGQAGPMAGCGMGCCCALTGGCGMAGAGPRMACMQKGRAAGCRMGMGANPGMRCGMMGDGRGGADCGAVCGPMDEGMGGGMCQHGCAGCYLKCADALKLTDKQIGDLKAICSAAKKAAIQTQANIRIAQIELNEILGEDVVDFAKAKAKITEISDLKASVQVDRLNDIQKAQKILTVEQMKQCKAMCKGTEACGAMTGRR